MRKLAIVALALSLTACGDESTSPRQVAFRPGAFEPSLRVTGPLPGRAVITGRVPQEVVRASVRELVVTGTGPARLPLYVGRSRDGRLCIGTTGLWECLRREDAQPVFSFTLQGGHGPIRDWGAVVGLAAPDVRVTVDHANVEVRLPLRRYRRFAWAAFASPMWRDSAPNLLHVYDRAGHTLSGFLDLAFAASPCPRSSGNCVPKGEWHRIGDPMLAASGAKPELIERAKRIAFADPLVRELLVGRRYSFGPAAAWSRCAGGTIGVHLNVHFPPATFTKDWPLVDYDANSRTAYVQRVEYYKVSNVTELDVGVDTNAGRVVSVDPTRSAPGAPEPHVNVFSMHPAGHVRPGGGPDRGDCSSSGD